MNTNEKQVLPTGKSHISYSEFKNWKECPYRHKLLYIDGIKEDALSPMLEYGSAMHKALERFLKSGEIDVDTLMVDLVRVWDEKGFDSEKFIAGETERSKKNGYTYEHLPLQVWANCAEKNLKEVPEFMATTYPGYKVISVEEQLFEPIEGTGFSLKGFVDAIIEIPTSRGPKTVLIDWKTTGPRGWTSDKRRDPLVQMQLVLYKHFWMQKTGQTSKDVRTAFVVIRRIEKGKNSFGTCDVSAGPGTCEKAVKSLKNMLSSIQKSFYLKNRGSCKYCPFYATKNCT